MFDADNTSLIHTDNCKNNFNVKDRLIILMLVLVQQRKKLVLTLLKQIQTFLKFVSQ